MLKTLSALLDRVAELLQRQEDLRSRLTNIRAQKEKLIDAADSDDPKSFARVGELGGQENLLLIALNKCDREVSGLGAALRNEADHVRRAVSKAGATTRDKILEEHSSYLERDIPNTRHRDEIVRSIANRAPKVRELERLAISLGNHGFDARGQTEIEFARQVFNSAKRAIKECEL